MGEPAGLDRYQIMATASMGGCIAGGWWWDFLWNAAINVGTDFVTDNDAVFDIWEDGNVN
ncbi:MAG: hypothetical protein ACYTHJ_23285 [Planctomycetota bacterium]|jgi:hypothetical protein